MRTIEEGRLIRGIILAEAGCVFVTSHLPLFLQPGQDPRRVSGLILSNGAMRYARLEGGDKASCECNDFVFKGDDFFCKHIIALADESGFSLTEVEK